MGKRVDIFAVVSSRRAWHLAWNKTVRITVLINSYRYDSTFPQPFGVRCRSTACTKSALDNIRHPFDQNCSFLICLNLKWVAKISDNENPSFNATLSSKCTVRSTIFRFFAAIHSKLIFQSCGARPTRWTSTNYVHNQRCVARRHIYGWCAHRGSLGNVRANSHYILANLTFPP